MAVKSLLRLLLGLLIIPLFASCSDDKASQAEDLLASVPADADMAGVIDMEAVISHLELDKKNPLPELKKRLETLHLNPDCLSGTRMSVAVVFSRGSKLYITGYLDDSKAFKKAFSALSKSTFKAEGNVAHCQASTGQWAAVCGNQFWLCDRGTPDANEIRDYSAQSKGYLSRKGAERLLEFKHDMAILGSISNFIRNFSPNTKEDFSSALVINSLFADPQFADAWIDFEKECLTLDAGFLNSSSKPAEFTLPLKKIDAELVKQTVTSADMIFAANIPSDAIKRIGKNFGAFLPMQNLEALDGTIAIAASEKERAISGVILTNGKNISGLTLLINELAPMDTEVKDNLLFFHTPGSITGPVNVAEAAKSFGHSYVGAIFKPSRSANFPFSDKWVNLSIYPSGSSARIAIKLSSTPLSK